MGYLGLEVSYLITKPKKIAEVIRLSIYTKKHYLRATLKEITNLINNKTLLVDELENGYPVSPCMYVYEANI